MDTKNAIDLMLGKHNDYLDKRRESAHQRHLEVKGKITKNFEPSHHHHIKPNKIDDETFWFPNNSGRINKGCFEGYYYDSKRRSVIDNNNIIIHKR